MTARPSFRCTRRSACTLASGRTSATSSTACSPSYCSWATCSCANRPRPAATAGPRASSPTPRSSPRARASCASSRRCCATRSALLRRAPPSCPTPPRRARRWCAACARTSTCSRSVGCATAATHTKRADPGAFRAQCTARATAASCVVCATQVLDRANESLGSSPLPMLRRLLIAEAPGRATHDAQLPVRPVLTTQPAARCVLQVPGFESLAANGLRELCTNYVAERLHHLFVEHVVGQVSTRHYTPCVRPC